MKFMEIWWFNGDLMGFNWDLMGLYSDLMDYEWDIPSGKHTKSY